MQTTSTSLGVLLRRVKEKSLTIPQFQRQFIWREAQVRSLIDSISRSYPVGSLLLLDKNPNLKLASRSIHAEIQSEAPSDAILGDLPASDVSPDVLSYILDGQQRITSIGRVFLNAHPQKVYYFDLKRMLDEHRSEETTWIKTRARGKTPPPERKDRNRLLRADVSLDQRKAEIYVNEYIEDSSDFTEFSRDQRWDALAYIKGVFETIRNYKIPIVSLDREGGVESICRVFETINSTGTRLRTFDLAVARFFPNPDLRRLWEVALDTHDVLRDFEVEGERILQVLALTDAQERTNDPDVSRYPEVSRKAQLSLRPNTINAGWSSAAATLADAYTYARSLGARGGTLPNHNIITAMAAVRNVLRRQGRDGGWSDPDFLKRWYFSKVLRAGSSQASNYRITQDFIELLDYSQGGSRPAVEDVRMDVGVVRRLRPTDARYKALQCIFASTIREDLISGRIIDVSSRLEDHHIFPRVAHKRHPIPVGQLDSICNRIYVLADSNRAIGEAYPQDYLREQVERAEQQGTLGAVKRRLRDCMIPCNDVGSRNWLQSLQVSSFDAFCEFRARLILDRVREVIGNSLKDGPIGEDEFVEED